MHLTARGGVAALILTALILLPGCASMRGAGAGGETGPQSMPWTDRLTALRALHHYEVRGRVAVTNGTDGFSAGLRWQQNDDQALVDLSAPLGFGAAHIQQTDNILRVTTSKGVTLDSDAANNELRTLLGFDAPLHSLRYWIIGASDPDSSSEVSLDASQRLVRLDQEGWRIDYGDYTVVQNKEWLPLSLTVTREALKLRIVIHDWQLYSILGD
jgi:outer membrane lipoprotein LolB